MTATAQSGLVALPDRRWALAAGVAGIAAVLGYVPLVTMDVPGPVAVLLAFTFGFGFMVASIGLHLGVTQEVAPRLGLVAAVANTVAAGELLAMLLVQMAVRAAEPHPGAAFTHIWLGLDVAWDLFGGAGTVLFGLALWRHPRFRPLTAGAGILAGGVLLVLNIGTFPTPPAEAGLVDVGPLVALWYVVLMVRVLVMGGGGAMRTRPAGSP